MLAGHENDSARFVELFPVSEDNPFVIITFEQLLAMLEMGTGVVAFGHPACPHCYNAFPILEKAFTEMYMERHAGFRGRILYYDIHDDRLANNERYQTILAYIPCEVFYF